MNPRKLWFPTKNGRTVIGNRTWRITKGTLIIAIESLLIPASMSLSGITPL